jgi:glycine oxidase
LILASGLRRNGWLLAPLVAEMVAAHVLGRDAGPWARLFHPRRFDTAET